VRRCLGISVAPRVCAVDRGRSATEEDGTGRPVRIVRADPRSGRWLIAILAPVLTRDRALLVGVGLDQARIDSKAVTANLLGSQRCFVSLLTRHPAKPQAWGVTI
jgi:hypothetical protein